MGIEKEGVVEEGTEWCVISSLVGECFISCSLAIQRGISASLIERAVTLEAFFCFSKFKFLKKGVYYFVNVS